MAWNFEAAPLLLECAVGADQDVALGLTDRMAGGIGEAVNISGVASNVIGSAVFRTNVCPPLTVPPSTYTCTPLVTALYALVVLMAAAEQYHTCRAAALAHFLDYVQAHEQVWITRRIDIAEHWHTTHPYSV